MTMSVRIKNLIWIFIDKVGLVALSLVTFLFFAYYLTPTELGVGVFIIAIYELFGVFLNMMLEDPLIRRDRIDSKSISTLLLFGSLISIFIVLIFTFISYISANDVDYSLLVLLAGFKLVFTVLSRPFIAALRKARKFKKLALRTLLGKVVGSLVAIFLASQEYGSLAVVSQGVVMEWVAFSTLLIFTDSWFSRKVSLSLFIEIMREGVPAAIKTSCNSVYERGVIIILGIVTSAEIVGLFSFGKRLIELPLSSLTTGLTSYSVPALASRNQNLADQARFLIDIAAAVALLFIPFFAVVATTGGEFITPIFGNKWSDAIPFFQLFAVIAIFKVISIFIPGYLVSNGAARIGLVPEVINSLIGLLLIYVASQIYSYQCIFFLIPMTVLIHMVSRLRSASKVRGEVPLALAYKIIPVLLVSALTSLVFLVVSNNMELNLYTSSLLAACHLLMMYLLLYVFCRRSVKMTFSLIKG